ncbi:hypothetical protein BRC84_04900 [Halobacteriales archaeon QS_1_68_44]|nr:MAG: hypothetical protein BRC84_04900 [Halobacteriales archaeon QS_1_68_44]
MTDPQDPSAGRQRSHAESVERILREVDAEMDEHAYPVRREDLATYYGDATLDLPNETESLGDAFDRLSKTEYETARELKRAVVGAVADNEEATVESFDPEEFGVRRDDEDRLGSTADRLEAPESPVDEEAPTEPGHGPDGEAHEDVYDAAETVEAEDREPDADAGDDIYEDSG